MKTLPFLVFLLGSFCCFQVSNAFNPEMLAKYLPQILELLQKLKTSSSSGPTVQAAPPQQYAPPPQYYYAPAIQPQYAPPIQPQYAPPIQPQFAPRSQAFPQNLWYMELMEDFI